MEQINDAIRAALERGHTIDITTTGRQPGRVAIGTPSLSSSKAATCANSSALSKGDVSEEGPSLTRTFCTQTAAGRAGSLKTVRSSRGQKPAAPGN